MSRGAAETPWDGALRTLWRRSRFTSYFYQFADFVPEPGLPTLGLTQTRGRHLLLYNPEFVQNTPEEHLVGLLVHEMLHVLLSHRHRGRAGEDAALRNLAQDMVVNSFLVAHDKTFFSRRGFQENPFLELPPGLPVIPPEFGSNAGKGGMADVPWEEVYLWLAARAGAGEQGEGDEAPVEGPGAVPLAGGFSGGADRTSEGVAFRDAAGRTIPAGVHLFESAEASDEADAGRKLVLRFIRESGQCEGERVFAEVASLLREPAPTRVSWRARIRGAVDRASRSTRWETSWARLNRRTMDSGFQAPGRVYRQKPLVTVAVDVSGSMAARPDRLEAAFGVVEDLAKDYRVRLLCLDQDVFTPTKQDGVFTRSQSPRPYYYQPGDWRAIRTGSRGATFFAGLFNRAMRGRHEMLLVITDGYIYDLEALRPYPRVLWVVPGERAGVFRPPFGAVVAMEGV